MSENILEISGLNKHFGPTYANRNISFSVKKGEIHGLIGENGSGKSTLLSQIAGMYPRDSSQMLIDGEPYDPTSPIDANERGISMVMQELGVVGNLPAGVNVYLGRTKQFSRFGIVNLRKMRREAEAQFEKWGLEAPPLGDMPDGMMIESRKMIELARALSVDPQLLLLDEVTQSLSLNNREKLYALIRRFKEMGRSVILITHDIEEMVEITDTITVLRDGEVIGSVRSAETTPDEIRMMMVGREMSGHYYRTDHAPSYGEQVVLDVQGVCVPGELEDVSFQVHEGEILGFCGLSDSGIHSVGTAVYGLSRISAGSVCLTAGDIRITSPTQALRNNVGYVPKDRDNEALMIHASIRDNFCLPSLTELKGPMGFLSPGKLKGMSADMVKQLSVKCTGIGQAMDALSGGNKQKVNFGHGWPRI